MGDARELVDRAEDRIELRERMRRLEERLSGPPPWWRNSKTVTLLASLLATVVPATTVLNAYLERESNLAMAAQQQQHAMRMDYVRTVLDSEVAEKDRESRLGLLLALLTPNDPLHRWAKNELKRVQTQIAELEQSLRMDRYELEKLRAEKEAVEAAKAWATTHPLPGENTTPVNAGHEIEGVKQRAARVRARARESARKLGGEGDDPLAGLDDL